MATENPPVPVEYLFHNGFPITMFDYRRVTDTDDSDATQAGWQAEIAYRASSVAGSADAVVAIVEIGDDQWYDIDRYWTIVKINM